MSKIIWCKESVDENPYLSDFYGDMNKYAFQMEAYMQLTRHRRIHKAIGEALPNGDKVISDWGPPCVFAETLVYQGLMNNRDYRTYKALVGQLDWIEPSCIVWLDVPLEECKRRILGRGRECETEIANPDNEYLEILRQHYFGYLIRLAKSVHVIRLGNSDLAEVVGQVRELFRDHWYISVMGLIGAGKSTICERIVNGYK